MASDCRSCRSPWTMTVRSSSATRALPAGEARREMGSGHEDRRRRHRRHRSEARPDRRELARHRRQRRDHRRQLVDPRVLPDSRAQSPGLHPRLRCAHRQAVVEVQSRAAAGRVRRRDLEERIEDRHRRRREERRVGACTPPIRSSASSTFRSACRSWTSTAATGPATTCLATASSRSM